MKKRIIYKDWKTIIKEYNQKIKIPFLGQFRKIIQINIYKELESVVCQSQKNVRDNVKKSQKNWHL